VFLRRGLSPAVSGQESGRVLRDRGVWSPLQIRRVGAGREGTVDGTLRVPSRSHSSRTWVRSQLVSESLTIGGLARAAGVHVETVRYYQRRGLLREPARPLNGIRRYAA